MKRLLLGIALVAALAGGFWSGSSAKAEVMAYQPQQVRDLQGQTCLDAVTAPGLGGVGRFRPSKGAFVIITVMNATAGEILLKGLNCRPSRDWSWEEIQGIARQSGARYIEGWVIGRATVGSSIARLDGRWDIGPSFRQ